MITWNYLMRHAASTAMSALVEAFERSQIFRDVIKGTVRYLSPIPRSYADEYLGLEEDGPLQALCCIYIAQSRTAAVRH